MFFFSVFYICFTFIFFSIYFIFFYDILVPLFYFVFFFFKQKTAYEMRISDWSSDVCSSDLHVGSRRRGDHLARRSRRADLHALGPRVQGPGRHLAAPKTPQASETANGRDARAITPEGTCHVTNTQIGRASWRERGCK